MTTAPPSKKYQYAAIYDVNEKYDDDKDEVATAVTVVEDEEENIFYYPVKQIYNSTSEVVTKRRKLATRRSCCCICGCITLSVFMCFFILLILIGIAYYALIAKGVRMVTVETPIDFPIVSVSKQELVQVSNEIDAFVKSIVNDDGTTKTKDLILSSRIINGAIAQSDYLRGHAQVTMKEDEFIFQTSLPMDMFPGGKHRFFVSTMDTTTTTGPAITTTSFDLGKKLSDFEYDGPLFVTELLSYLSTTTDTDPEWVINVLSMKSLGQEIMTPEMLAENINILQALKEDPNIQHDPNSKYLFKFINGIDSIHIEPDQIIIRARNTVNDANENMEDDEVVVNKEERNNNKKPEEDGPKRFLRRYIK